MVHNYVKSCQQCQQNKLSNKVPRIYRKYPVTSRFRTVHIDLVGPLPESSLGSLYILSIIDRFTRWYEAIPLKSITASCVVEAFYKNWVARFGIPDILVTDQGSQFESRLFNEVCSQLGIKHRRTTAYHPAANGLVERVHRTFKNCLRCLIGKFKDWERALPSALLAIRTAVNDLGVSPSLLVYGEQLAIPGLLVSPPLSYQEACLTTFTSELTSDLRLLRDFVLQHDDTLKGPSGDEGQPPRNWGKYTRVWLKGSFAPKYLDPYEVQDKEYPVLTLIRDGKP